MTQDQTNWPPFLKWGAYKSSEESNPDILGIKVTDTETFETQYSTNVNAQLNDGQGWIDVVIPLKYPTCPKTDDLVN